MKVLPGLLMLWFAAFPLAAQDAASGQGKLMVTSGGQTAEALFRQLIAGPEPSVVFIPTGASSLRSDSGVIWNPDKPEHRAEYEQEILKLFGLKRVTILHTRDRQVADTDAFVTPLRTAQAVWISGGNPGRLADAYLGTKVVDALKALIDRGGIVAGESAGAIIQGSYIVRGNPNKPVLMVDGHDRGLGLLPNVAINPHLSSNKRENELVSVIDRYPQLLGIGIDDDAGLLVSGEIAQVFGKGRVAIYDNRKHKDGWYYWLNPGDRFDLKTRMPIGRPIE
ncbi:MAG TPA: cyanophycinase [Candidatus Acidoferrales bacterium]|nr:cyanophycinase [Candidatus Acidoferrales bacterium]